MMTPGRLDVGLVGNGRESVVMALALAGAGHIPWSMTEPHPLDRDRVLSMLRGITVKTAAEVVESSDLVILGPGDGETLEGLIESLEGLWKPGQIVVHNRPEYGIEVLAAARAVGVIPLAIHPVIHFTGTSLDVHRMKDAYCAVTAPATALPIAQALVVEMGGEPFVVEEADRAAYAEVIDTVSTFSKAIIDQSTFRLTQIGVDRPGEVLRALVHSAVDESLRRNADGSIDPVEQWLGDHVSDTDD
jgi:predicted short-subunit dehydrogenase-like oxidoreductase (DUF2520 family)